MSWLFDTNIIIDFLNSVPQARSIFTPETERAISIRSWIEVMTGATAETEPAIRSVLSTCKVVPLTPEIAERAAILRRQTRLKLPDAIILADGPAASPHPCHPKHPRLLCHRSQDLRAV